MTLFTAEDSKEKWNYNSKMRIVKVKKVTLQKLYVPIDYITKMNEILYFFFCGMNRLRNKISQNWSVAIMC